jgi:hypothetical protein
VESLEMGGETKSGVSTISLERLQCAWQDSAVRTERRRRRKKGKKHLAI